MRKESDSWDSSNSYYLDFRTFSIKRAEMANHVVFALSRARRRKSAA